MISEDMLKLCISILLLTKIVIGIEIVEIPPQKNSTTDSDSFFSSNSKENESENNAFTSQLIVPDMLMIAKAFGTLPENQCQRDGHLVLAGISNREQWAMQLFDSIPKFPEGVLYGSRYQLGNFDECLAVHKNRTDTNNFHEHDSIDIEGRYCTFLVSFPETKAISRKSFNSTQHWSICVPSICSSEEVEDFLQALIEEMLPDMKVVVNVKERFCHTNNDDYEPLNTLEIIYGSIILSFLLIVLLSTIYHIFYLYKKSTSLGLHLQRYRTVHDTIIAFSIPRNVGKILVTKNKGNDQNLDCILGIRVLSMVFIISAHSLAFLLSGPVLNMDYYNHALLQLQNGLLINNTLLVDTFLLLSGFLMCKILLHELDKRNGKINVFLLYIARYIRLTPAYLVVIGFYCTFLRRAGKGPLWNDRMLAEQERCLNSWWTNILYINNYFNTDYLCMFQSWYLSVDSQLFVIAPLFVFPLWKSKRLGEVLLGTITVFAALVPAAMTYYYELDPTLMNYAPEINDLSTNSYFVNAYIKTHMRATSYLLGLGFGYVVHRIQSSGMKINNYVKIFGSLLAIICGVSSMFSVLVFYLPNHRYNVLESAVYSGLHRLLWCYAVGWTILYCVTVNTGYINKFLSWKVFAPLSRLTYCSYLINGFVELYNYGITRNPYHMSTYNLVHNITGHIMETFTIAFILCVLFESPIHSLEKILLRKDKSKRDNINLINGNSR